ncbi:MAG: HEPN domain-containing protein [Melioribacteraceae bacterium]
MTQKFKPAEEWLLQAEYDMDTAEAMFNSGRFIYAIFMIHLSLEKAVKAVYAQTYEDNPPKTHHLLYLIEKIQSKTIFDIPENILAPIREIDKISVPVRYPENLRELAKDFTFETTSEIFTISKEVLLWLKSKLTL